VYPPHVGSLRLSSAGLTQGEGILPPRMYTEGTMRSIVRGILAALVVAGLACGGDGGSGPTSLAPSTTYRGIITASDGTTAGLVLTFSSAVSVRTAESPSANLVNVVVPVTGVATVPGGGTVNLTGTLDGNALSLTGGGYTLTGTLSRGQFSGTFTGPGGASGSFSALSSTDVTPAYAYCGTFSGVITPGNITEDGSFNMVVAGTIVSGAAAGSGGSDVVTFSGRASAGANSTTTITVNQTSVQGAVKADGTITADFGTVSGTYQVSVIGEGGVNNGTFEGSLCPGTVPTLR